MDVVYALKHQGCTLQGFMAPFFPFTVFIQKNILVLLIVRNTLLSMVAMTGISSSSGALQLLKSKSLATETVCWSYIFIGS